MLRETPQQRPNIYQVVVEVCAMRHRSVPISDVRLEHIPIISLLTKTRYIPIGPSLRIGTTSNYPPLTLALYHLLLLDYKRLRLFSRYNPFQTLLR
jgi:hypothetical protein